MCYVVAVELWNLLTKTLRRITSARRRRLEEQTLVLLVRQSDCGVCAVEWCSVHVLGLEIWRVLVLFRHDGCVCVGFA